MAAKDWEPETCEQMLARLKHSRHELVMAYVERDQERLFEVLRNIDAVIETLGAVEQLSKTHNISVNVSKKTGGGN